MWRAADRFWHFLVIVALAAALLPLVAHGPAGDVSRYLPTGLFPDGADGKDQVVLASAAATVLISAVLAAGLWTAVTTYGGACGQRPWTSLEISIFIPGFIRSATRREHFVVWRKSCLYEGSNGAFSLWPSPTPHIKSSPCSPAISAPAKRRCSQPHSVRTSRQEIRRHRQ